MKRFHFSQSAAVILVLTTLPLSISFEASARNTVSTLSSPEATAAMDEFGKFTPRPSRKVKLDFERMDLLLQRGVLFTGPSLRQRAGRPDPFTGTRFIKKHTSPYRLEGNKVAYSLFDNKQKSLIKGYLSDLEVLSNELDIASLPKNDQLAYWFNLHNLALINEISDRYPLRYPNKIKPNRDVSVYLHDAKILTVSGVKLSLRDIREKIVYANWSNPIVIYGFHDGTLGAPGIPAIAFERDNVGRLLTENAQEFVNSLRGFEEGKVSQFYKETAPFYFKNFEPDLRNHFKKYMRPEVFGEVENTDRFTFHREIDIIADLTGGYGNNISISPLLVNGSDSSVGLPAGAVEYIENRRQKIIRLRERGLFSTGTVTIEDIETDPNQPVE